MNVQGSIPRVPGDSCPGLSELAHRPGFVVGPVEVEPSARRIRSGEGRERVLQPLAMRVLAALAEAGGETCSRDDLLAKCWGRTIVGDDAIHRIISNLRRDLAAVAGDAVGIETIAKVGYRLRVDEHAGGISAIAPEPAAASPAVPGRGPPRLLKICLAAVAILATTSAALSYNPAPSVTIAVEPVISASGGAADLFADDLTTELARLASPMTGLTFLESAPAGASSDLVLRTSLGNSADGPNSHVRLVDGETGAVIWSRDFEAQGNSLAALRERIAYAVAGVIHCGLDRSADAFAEPVSRRLYLSACDAVEEGDYARAHSYAEQIAALRPDAAASWACLALTTILKDPEGYGTEDAVSRRAMTYARRALALDPRSGMAHIALAHALDRQGQPSFSTLEKGMGLDPDHAGLQARYAEQLMLAGYVEAAVEPTLRAIALQPHSNMFYDRAFYTLLRAGRESEAVALHRRMGRLWRNDPKVAVQRAELLFYRDDAAAALAEFDRNPPPTDPSVELLREKLTWRADPARYDWTRFDRLAERLFEANRDAAWNLSYAAVRMHDKPRALAWLDRGTASRSGAWTVLFATDAVELRGDPRFLAKMAELGLVAFWHERDEWPDFCSGTDIRYACGQQAQRIAARGRASRNPL
jgi:DNA-binding winged helix-turn-helix (wHTH) protein/tetratricopeptide (TPR) repeat protein